MTKRRMIHSCIWPSEDVGSLTIQQRLLWVGLITTADDQGRGRAHPGLIRSAIFPFDDLTLPCITEDLEAIAGKGFIILYRGNDKDLYQVVKWWEYQRPQWAYPSEFEPPPDWSDRLRYRKSNKIITENWIGKALGKALPKAKGNALVYGHSISTSNSKEKDSAAKPAATPPEHPKKAPKKPKTPTHPAITTFRENAHRYPAKAWYSKIESAVGDSEKALELWGSVVLNYVGMGWNPQNVKGMLEFFERGEVPKSKGNGRGDTDDGWHIPGGSA
ncbi:MAG: hypothetical protein GY841_10275 [FCB group bacterium]|nr:hypothetical protein [FCB group bacterium]